MMTLSVPVLSLSLLLAASTAFAQPVPRPAPPPDPLVRMNESIDALTRKVWPSVVQIMVSSYGPQNDGPQGSAGMVIGRQQSTGSGFVIDGDGYIMTNAHVVNGARRVQILLPQDNADGTLKTALSSKSRLIPAQIVGITTELDLALLKVDGLKLPALPLATYTQVRQGEMVFAFGSPNGLRNSLTHGLVSAVARQVDPDSPQIFVQTDAPINPGNSGGPLVNIRGEVVGINTFILSQSGGNEGLGFAIPSATARTVFRQLRQYGQLRRQEVGMSMQTINEGMAKALGLARDYGLIVSDVWPGGPAEAAGLAVGDILVSVDGQPADNLPTVSYNFRLRDSLENVQLVVLRGAAQISIGMKPVEARSDFDSVSSMADPTKNLVPELGIIGVEVDAKLAATATGLRDPYGVIVVARAAGSGSDVPLMPRDVIRSVNNRRIGSLDALRDSVKSLTPGAPVTMQIQREDRLMYLSFTFE
ncbi:MAG: trypsin-like peptidase domain-containing protein [Vicinamibacterales bacterium]|nr:trypsin-like peptidase domain-containing protein [Vicinamibacterales bacterium]